MTRSVSTIERALQLAREGSCKSVSDIKRRLTAEQFDQVHLHVSGAFAKQLRGELAKRN